MKDKENKLQ